MSKQLISTGLTIAVVALAVSAAVASDGDRNRRDHVKARLDGYQVAPRSLATTGSGKFVAQIDDHDMTIDYALSYEDLEGGAATFAHIHLGQRATGGSGDMSAYLCGGPKPECPPAGGTVTGVLFASDIIGPAGQGIPPGDFDKFVRAIRAGATFVDVHTTGRPGGEIRGQIKQRDDN
jgi:hypothetical protein